MEFSHKAIEKKWQKYWIQNNINKTINDNKKPKFYILDMFPYPSGSGLHVGHIKGYSATDIYARYKKLQGFDVLHPMGYDAFGLPAEQYALKTGNDPREFTLKNIDNFRMQLMRMGFNYDYQKEVITSHPNFYKITQWIFIQLYKKGLAEIKNINVNWCPSLGTVLANEEVINQNGKMISEVGGFEVFKKPMRQWVLKITKYADQLLDGLNTLDWPKSVKDLQKNWIGKSYGTIVSFKVEASNYIINVFTTRLDTIYGVTYLVLAPENTIVPNIVCGDNSKISYEKYLQQTMAKTDLERQDDSKEKNGLFLNAYAIHPLTNKRLPIWISDYVLNDYATGSVMAVPAHDHRDFVFAKKYNLPIEFVLKAKTYDHAFVGSGEYINSFELDGLTDMQVAKDKIFKIMAKKSCVKKQVYYKLRDWLFSRQRFYGEPFPIAYDENKNIVLLEDQLPIELPKCDYICPSGTGESPLANLTDWLNIHYRGKKLTRETNTMPQWAGSSWYYLAYILAINPNEFIDIDSKQAKHLFDRWLNVDLYLGGQEHAVGHLLYARFWHKVLYELNIVSCSEPFQKLINQGMVLDQNGEKMSKSKGNVISPDEIIDSHGADALRLYISFMSPVEASLQWNNDGLDAARRWLDRVYRTILTVQLTDKNDESLDKEYNSMLKKYTQLMEKLKYNNAISQLMIFINALLKVKGPIYRQYILNFLIILSPITPHLCEELWEKLGQKESITIQCWPNWNEKKTISSQVTIAVQVNGKLKTTFETAKNSCKQDLLKIAKDSMIVQKALNGKTIIKEIVVIDKIVNFVVK